MIRIETDSGWILVEHPEHARLAGRFAAHWGNDAFAAPEPRADILTAVLRHDDAWAGRDSTPFLTREGRPSAFSRELVGKYSAFEEIDLADYLSVRGRASEVVAADNPYAALIISLHTMDLLTAQADLSGLSDADRKLHSAFVEAQLRRQDAWTANLAKDPRFAQAVAPERLVRAFEFLQVSDSFSLTVCVRFPVPIALRHRHPLRYGGSAVLNCIPLGNDTYRIDPYPLDADEIVFELPCRRIEGKTFPSQDALRQAYSAAEKITLRVKITR
jgi:Protein of unknown function (DUF3891)